MKPMESQVKDNLNIKKYEEIEEVEETKQSQEIEKKL